MRNNTLDFFKLVASFSVITLHVGLYADTSQIFGEIIRLSGRWAVPFFFLVTGVFIAINKKENKLNKQAVKVIRIFLVSSVLFLPYFFLKNNADLSSVSLLRVLYSGTSFHLWFLSSLAIGLVSFQIINTILPRLIFPISILIILLYAVCDIFAWTPNSSITRDVYSLIRHATAFSFISLGYLLVDKSIVKNTPVNAKEIVIVTIILGLFLLEPFLIYKLTGSEVIQRQFPIFTPIVAVIILMLCFKLNTKRNILSEAGEKYSLGIYLVHPLFIPIYSKLLLYMNLSNTILLVIMIFFSAWAFVLLLKTTLPFFFNLLYGTYKGNTHKSLKRK